MRNGPRGSAADNRISQGEHLPLNSSRHWADVLIWLAEGLAVFPPDLSSALYFGNGELRIDFGDGDVDLYRIKDGQLELFSCRSRNLPWYPLSPEEILQHVVLHTPVATWLHARLRLKAASEIHSQLEDMRGGVMVTDPVCDTEVAEIDVPESLQSEFQCKIYYFRSHECKSEFEQKRKRFAQLA